MKVKRILLSIVAAVLICAISVGGTMAVLKKQTGPVTNTFMSAGLLSANGVFELKEHKAVYNSNLSKYELTTEEVISNEYAVDESSWIPKDPFVRITNKNSVPAYIFVEVCFSSGFNFSFQPTSDWNLYVNDSYGGWQGIVAREQLNEALQNGIGNLFAVCQQYGFVPAQGPNGGLLYYYANTNGSGKIVQSIENTDGTVVDDFVIPFLAKNTYQGNDNEVYVIGSSGTELSGAVTFYAYMVSATNGMDPLTAFSAANFSSAS